ncbi:MAG: hypothetical protein U0938_12890 [Thiobacillus sp.]|nr:hypothetical protein [Thiobacillus sp.]
MSRITTIVSILMLGIIGGCATPKANYQPVTVNISEPPINSVNVSLVGDEILKQGKYREHEALRVDSQLKPHWAYTVHPGHFLKMGEDESGEFYRIGGAGEDSGYVEKFALADNYKSLMVKSSTNTLCVVTVFNVAACLNGVTDGFEKIKKPVVTQDAIQRTLIYNGKSGDKINIGYREFSGNLARPAFNNNVEYDMSESAQIGYKGALLEIIEATNKHIKYKVLSNFNNAVQ